MATDHDFSFPTFSDAIDSPPLWTSSPAKTSPTDQKHEKSNDEDEEMESYKSRRKSFSWIETKKTKKDEDENMDMLWENFNEELRQTTSDSDDDYKSIDVGCVQLLQSPALRLSKNGHKAIVSTRRTSNSEIGFPMFNKVFRKLFLVHSNSHGRSSGFSQKNHCTVGKCRRPKSLSW